MHALCVDSRAGSAGVCACRDGAMMFRVGEEKREEVVGGHAVCI